MNLSDLKDRVVVTGAGSGIGRGIALGLGQVGARLLDGGATCAEQLQAEVPPLPAVVSDAAVWQGWAMCCLELLHKKFLLTW